MVSTIRVLFLAVIVLFSLCCCGKKGVDVSLDAIMPDTTILSDPYRTFTPDIYESIEHNDKYREWFFNGAFQNVNVEKLKFFKQKDTLVYIGSGIRGMNTLVNVSTRQILPKEGKSMELRLIYEYAPYPPEATMTLRTRFFTHNTLLKELTEKVSSTPKRDENGKQIESDDVSMVKYKYHIPRGADNVEVSLKTFNGKVLFEDACDIENLLKDACDDRNRHEGTYYYDGPQEDSTRSVVDAVKYGYAILFLNRFEIKINRKNIEEYIYNHKHLFTEEELTRISEKTADSISIDGKVKIVGIGETVHGCAAFSKQEAETVKHLIKNGFNRIGLETSPLLGIQINDYVNGRPIDLDSILSQGIFNYSNNKETKALFDYIKTYNKRTDRKISVFGFDIHSDNSIEAMEALVSDGTAVHDSLYAGYLLNFIKKYGKGYKCGNSRNILLRIRDKIMSENIMYITDRAAIGDKIVLMAHFGHLARRKLPRPSTGGYLSERYGDEYAVIGMFVGEGDFHSRHVHGFDSVTRADKYPLSKPTGKSLEQLCSLMDKKEFYINEVCSLGVLDKVLYARSIGSSYNVMQFEPIDLRKELDIVWFTKESYGEQ